MPPVKVTDEGVLVIWNDILWVIYSVLDHLVAKKEGYDIFVKVFGAIVGILTAIAAVIGVWVGVIKYFYEKNRSIYERRLNEVYAPLYGLLAKQEIFRDIHFPQYDINQSPIITTRGGTVKPWDREKFIKVLNDTNKGLARPRLLKLLYEYEALIFMEENIRNDEKKWYITTTQKVEVERAIVSEIIDGYKQTISKLSIDNMKATREIFDYQKGKRKKYREVDGSDREYMEVMIVEVSSDYTPNDLAKMEYSEVQKIYEDVKSKPRR